MSREHPAFVAGVGIERDQSPISGPDDQEPADEDRDDVRLPEVDLPRKGRFSSRSGPGMDRVRRGIAPVQGHVGEQRELRRYL